MSTPARLSKEEIEREVQKAAYFGLSRFDDYSLVFRDNDVPCRMEAKRWAQMILTRESGAESNSCDAASYHRASSRSSCLRALVLIEIASSTARPSLRRS